jgi:hypothetical protein
MQVYGLSNMFLLFSNDIYCVGALVQICSICVLLMVVFFFLMSFNLYLYIKF